ncbi:hypothetical protein G3O08_01440 [Cryomorpha ignava]|uniref:Uncharacterized protein n=1 Tax=Cryomorpha ignava TaxID=101383 RepID=A0A7K3WN87_9FLAO|nr:hypothetical protein [Cryomorpha ignava]NEN22165.1 hypothetical protein [Cryomorpha ignava]
MTTNLLAIESCTYLIGGIAEFGKVSVFVQLSFNSLRATQNHKQPI